MRRGKVQATFFEEQDVGEKGQGKDKAELHSVSNPSFRQYVTDALCSAPLMQTFFDTYFFNSPPLTLQAHPQNPRFIKVLRDGFQAARGNLLDSDRHTRHMPPPSLTRPCPCKFLNFRVRVPSSPSTRAETPNIACKLAATDIWKQTPVEWCSN